VNAALGQRLLRRRVFGEMCVAAVDECCRPARPAAPALDDRIGAAPACTMMMIRRGRSSDATKSASDSEPMNVPS